MEFVQNPQVSAYSTPRVELQGWNFTLPPILAGASAALAWIFVLIINNTSKKLAVAA